MQPASFKIQVDQLSPAFIKDMKEKYGSAELEIKVNRKPNYIPLSEEAFWKIIDLLDWEKSADQDILAPAIQKLSNLPIAHIYSFEDILSEKLFQLDQKELALHIGQNAYGKKAYFSVDTFLYARACVVANGKSAFKAVIENPKEMPEDITFEPLLFLAAQAYQMKTGEKFDYRPIFNYETYANKKGWQQ